MWQTGTPLGTEQNYSLLVGAINKIDKYKINNMQVKFVMGKRKVNKAGRKF